MGVDCQTFHVMFLSYHAVAIILQSVITTTTAWVQRILQPSSYKGKQNIKPAPADQTYSDFCKLVGKYVRQKETDKEEQN